MADDERRRALSSIDARRCTTGNIERENYSTPAWACPAASSLAALRLASRIASCCASSLALAARVHSTVASATTHATSTYTVIDCTKRAERTGSTN